MSALRQCYDRHHDLVNRYGIYVSQVITDMFHLSKALPSPSVFMAYLRVCNYSSVTGGINRAGTAYPPEHLSLPSFLVSGVRIARSLVFCVMFCISLFVLLYFWPMCFLSFFSLRILITPLVSSKEDLYICIYRT